MATQECSREHGVGRAIVQKLEALARAHGVARIVLNTSSTVVPPISRPLCAIHGHANNRQAMTAKNMIIWLFQASIMCCSAFALIAHP